MNRKLILALPLLIAGMLALGTSAHAACPVDNPTCGVGDPPTTKTLHVVDSSQATVTATGINCGVAGDDCQESYTYAFDEEIPSVTMTATGVPAGYTARLFKCTTTGTGSTCGGSESQCGVGACTLTMDANYRVRLAVADETPPSTATVSGPDKVGPSVRHFTASASDGAGVVSYRYYLDGIDQGLFSPGAGYDVPVDSVPAGSHTLTARGRDAAGNESNAVSATKSFTVDKSTGATGVSTPPAFTQSAPGVTFSVPADAASVVCRTKLGATQVSNTSSCSSPYTPQGITTDGQYTVEIAVTDDVGNSATVTRAFTYDSQAPAVSITGGPGEGTVVYARSTAFTFATSDLTAVTISCDLDDGAFGACTSATGHNLDGLSLGIHTFTVRVVDAAGHTTTVQRRFAVADLPAGSGGAGGTGGTAGTGGTNGAGGTSGAGGTAGSDGSGKSVPSVKSVTLTTSWRLFGKLTRADALTLAGVPRGAKVTVTCQGKGCAFKKMTLTATGTKIKLADRFKRRKLAANTVITITVSNKTGTKRFRYTLRAGKSPRRSIT